MTITTKCLLLTNITNTYSIDKHGKSHNIVEAAELFYKSIKKPIDFSTAGWDIDNEYCNQAARELVEKIKTNHEIFRGVDVSIHPFQKQMLKANAYLKRSCELKDINPELAEQYYQKYLVAEEDYINRMANVLKILAPIMKPGYSHIDSQYIYEENKSLIFTKKQTEDLINKILNKTKELCEKEEIESYILTNGLEAFKKDCMYPPRKIYNTPRIKANSLKTLPNTYYAELSNGKMNLVVEPFDKTFFNFFENEIAQNVTETLKEDENSFEKIIINIDLNNSISKKLQDAGFLNK